MKNSGRMLFLAALFVGLGLRLFGISHDLDKGEIYHPDTPKQISATQLYLRGIYYRHFGYSDYDGYPLFNSHLVEYIVRISRPVLHGAQSLIGVRVDEEWPDKQALFWITRLLSVALSTLAIWIVYLIGVENFSGRAGALAAWLLALSPVDVLSAHYETCDTTASFFAIVCVLFAMRIYRRGADRDYLFAAFFGMCAFAAKYNAGMAMVAPIAAHVLRQKRWYDVFDGVSFRQLLLFGATAVVALFLTIPSMFSHPVIVPQEIVAFFRHVSGTKYIPEAIRDEGLRGRLVFAMTRNVPIVAMILSPPLALVSLLGLVHVLRWNRQLIVLYALPATYFVLGISLRPLASPVYHTLMTAALYAICAVILLGLFELPAPWRRAGAVGGSLMIAASFGFLICKTAEQDFYFWHSDTRRAAEQWSRENVPASFLVAAESYTFPLEEFGARDAGPEGALGLESNMAQSRNDHLRDLKTLFASEMGPLKEFALEDSPMTFFRNPILNLHVRSPSLEPGFRMPVFQRAPSMTGNDMIFDGGPEFIRSEKVLYVGETGRVQRILVRSNELDRAVIVLRNGIEPSALTVSFGGRTEPLVLASNERRILAFDHPRRGFPFESDRFFYRLDAAVHAGRIRLTLATTPREEATALYDDGFYKEACPLLAAAAQREQNPTLAGEALLASLLADVALPDAQRRTLEGQAELLRGSWSPGRVLQTYGIAPAYLGALDFLRYNPCNLPFTGFGEVHDPMAAGDRALYVSSEASKGGAMIAVPGLMLDPGSYLLRIDARTPYGRDSVVNAEVVLEASGMVATNQETGGVISRTLRTMELTNTSFGKTGYVAFEVPHDVNVATLVVRPRAGVALTIDSVSIAPSPVASLDALGHVVGLLDGSESPSDMRDLLAYKPLLALGDRHAATGAVDRAVDCYMAANRLCPELAAPAAKLYGLRDRMSPAQREETREQIKAYAATLDARVFHEARASFTSGVRLDGYRVSVHKLQRQDTFGLNLYWGLDHVGANLERHSVWVHIIDDKGKIAFQADHVLIDDLVRNPDVNELHPMFYEVKVPPDAKIGAYRIKVGLCLMDGDKERVKIKSTTLPTNKEGVILPEDIRIVP